MANLIAATSQSSLLLHPHATLKRAGFKFVINQNLVVSSSYHSVSSSTRLKSGNKQLRLPYFAIPVSMASSLNVELTGEQVEIKPDFIGGGGDEGVNGGGGGGGGGGGDDNDGGKSDEGSDDANAKRNKALLMSQKFTLGFAALVGFGGLMGYLKSGSQKSLAFGGLSALLLYYVYTELPKRPVFASSVGLGLSAALLVVMGSRFKKSGKIFPAGIVSLVSLIMTGGYMHGIVKAH